MPIINSLRAREILDSRGNPTIEVVLRTENGEVRSSVPSGASTGDYEAVELRDGKKRYHGKGVLKAVDNVNRVIAKRIKGKSSLDQQRIDQILISLDGTDNKSGLGANALLGVSMAVCRAGALSLKLPLYKYIRHVWKGEGSPRFILPRPCFNIINGGAHAGNNLDFQEFMIVPRKRSAKEAVREASEFYHSLKTDLRRRYSSSSVNVGDEGGFAPSIEDPEEAINLILGIGKADLLLDAAAGEFFDGKKYKMKIGSLKSENLLKYHLKIVGKYPIIGIEDPFSENDWDGWTSLSAEAPKGFLVVGDDLLATDPGRIKKAESRKACNAAILKLNQIGTVTEALAAARAAKELGWKTIVSHRSGETNDDFITDFAVGISSDFIKSGAPARGERVAKYNRLMEIEEDLK